MALIKCPECEKEISDKSKACPHCGFPSPEQTQRENEVAHDNEKEPEKKVVTVGDQDAKIDSFWSYTAAKILLGLVILSLCFSGFSIYASQKASGLEEKLQATESHVQYLRQRLELIDLSINASEGIVTDKVIVQKAMFYVFMDELTGSIDIRPQPSYEYKFLGRGEFDLTDRELRSMLEELVHEIENYLESYGVGTTYDGLTPTRISLTANNYAVAVYEDGVITLAGE